MSAVDAEIEAGHGRELSLHERMRIWAAVVPADGTIVLSPDLARAMVREFEAERRNAAAAEDFDGVIAQAEAALRRAQRALLVLTGVSGAIVLALGAIVTWSFSS